MDDEPEIKRKHDSRILGPTKAYYSGLRSELLKLTAPGPNKIQSQADIDIINRWTDWKDWKKADSARKREIEDKLRPLYRKYVYAPALLKQQAKGSPAGSPTNVKKTINKSRKKINLNKIYHGIRY